MDKHRVLEFLEQSEDIPILPKNISEILEMLKDPCGFEIDHLVQKVTQSVELNDIMLKNLNSGYFQLNKKIKTIKEAVVYLGMQTVQNLIIFYISRLLFPNITDRRKRSFDIYKYWNHVLGTSVAASILASRINCSDKYKLFSYGLIHDIGIPVLDTCLPEFIDEVSLKVHKGMHQIVAERSVLGGLTHSDIGAWLCEKWNLREDIINIVKFHHTPFVPKINIKEVQLLHIADVISTEYYEKLLGLNLNSNVSKSIMKTLGITEDDYIYVAEILPEEVDKLNSYLLV
ncbi:hypothetical protein BHU72_12155 [Desulfuribacillus stibiiarsenatis]|uniref:HDOD domain-containing protein n=1 Tax=Desulfuribacillus stibiiarsenatis TaxID=1390249 RepID=A0A1E5L297_9FIRM|nr:HDOD domain-containing protein [Desulfuribacillus stibiiarsenatis]OEH84153.1 hypothetical protein BHU72_12155 [Desulfuribacillus stibiiarsenatis]